MKHAAWEPCLACHEPVHPVAGRCKHCKADLVALRAEAAAARKRAAAEARAAAATPLRVAMTPPAATRPLVGTRSRNILYAAAVVVLLVGIAGGVVAQQIFARASATPTPGVRQAAAADPIDDPVAPAHRPFDFTDPFPTPQRNPPDPMDPTDPQDPGDPNIGGRMADPWDLFQKLLPTDPSVPKLRPRGPRDPLPNVDDVQLFLPAVVDVVCDKLQQCGVFEGAASGMCKMMANGLTDDETVERVRSGQCRYDADAARECLAAVGGLTCDNTADPQQMFALTDSIASCSRTLSCP